MIVAIDGPAGAGKSTVTSRLAARLGFIRIDTGALYRVVALLAFRLGLPPEAEVELAAAIDSARIVFRGDHVLLDDEDVTLSIREPAISLSASRYAAVPAVRASLLEIQRRLGRASDAVLDGRDIGTVVFPNADVKIFLTATADARARRRHAELLGRGADVVFDDVLREIVARDHQDESRPIAPLRCAHDAVLVDATTMTIEEAVDACEAAVQARARLS